MLLIFKKNGCLKTQNMINKHNVGHVNQLMFFLVTSDVYITSILRFQELGGSKCLSSFFGICSWDIGTVKSITQFEDWQ